MSVREIDQSLYELSHIDPQRSRDLYSIDGYIALLDHAKSVMDLLDSMSDLSDRCRAIIDGRFVTSLRGPQQYLGKVTARLTNIEGKMHQMTSKGNLKGSSAKRVLRGLIQELRDLQDSVEQRADIDISVRSSTCEKITTLMDRLTELCEASDTALSVHLPTS